MANDTRIELILNELEELKARDILLIDVKKMCHFADYMVICTATSSRHCNAIFNKLAQQLKAQGLTPFKKDYNKASEWMILDYSDVVIHIMQEQARSFYSLEKLWFETEDTLSAV